MSQTNDTFHKLSDIHQKAVAYFINQKCSHFMNNIFDRVEILMTRKFIVLPWHPCMQSAVNSNKSFPICMKINGLLKKVNV